MSPAQVLRVSRFDPASATSKQKQIIQLDESLEEKKLRDIRDLLWKNNVFESKDFKSPFCEKNGAGVIDDMPFKVYLGLLGNHNPSSGSLDVYFKTKKIFTPIDQATQDLISTKLDLAFQQDPDLITKNPELLTSSFNPKEWKAVKGDISHASDLTERDWSAIIRTNCLLSGHRALTTQFRHDGTPMEKIVCGIERSPYNAFQLIAREFEAYEISSNGLDDLSDGTDKKFRFRIPRFRVDDDSSVTVVETKTSLEKSMVDSSFSETSFQVAAGGGFLGVSAGVNAGAAMGESNESSSVSARAESSLVANYNFPRVTLYWDDKSLEVSDQCLEDIDKVVDSKTLNDFNDKYGHIFSRRVQLGGRLSSSQKIVQTEKGGTAAQAEKLKVNASASINSSFFQASVEYSQEKQSKQSENTSSKGLNTSMAWEATGGDTLLCNNPAQWCSTVSLHDNWRIVNQSDVVPLYKFLARFPNAKNKDIINRFEKSAKDKYVQQQVTTSKDASPPSHDSPDKIQYQAFQLLDVKTNRPVVVELGDRTIVEKVHKDIKPWAKEAEATIKLGEKNDETDASYFSVKQSGGIKYRQRILASSEKEGGRHILASNKSDTNLTGGSTVWVHLIKENGFIKFYKTDNTADRGHIKDNDKVYLVVYNGFRTNPTSELVIRDITGEGLLEARESWSDSKPHERNIFQIKFV